MSGITDPTEEYFKDGTWGWDGSRWRKLGLLLGYNDVISGSVDVTAQQDGINSVSSSSVQDGELWVLNNIAGTNANRAIPRIIICAEVCDVLCVLLDTSTTSDGVWAVWNGTTVLKASNRIMVYFYGCTAGDTLRIRWLGYKVKLE